MWHEAIFYSTDAEYVASIRHALSDAARRDQSVLLAVARSRAELLSGVLDAPHVEPMDMTTVGRNPGRIITTVQSFVEAHPGRDVVVINEPHWPERDQAEEAEVIRAEALLNCAFAGTGAKVLCPYQSEGLPRILRDAHRTHPRVRYGRGATLASRNYTDPERIWRSTRHLPRPETEPRELNFDARGLSAVRQIVRAHAIRARLADQRVDDLVAAVSELAANSVRHASGSGQLRIWAQTDAVFCEVQDRGRLDDPLAGHRKPAPAAEGGWGLWLVNQLCDLVQLHASPSGVTVRVRMNR